MKRNESVICHQGVSIAAYDHTASNEFSRHRRLLDAQSPSWWKKHVIKDVKN